MIILSTGISGVGKRSYFQSVVEWGKLNDVDIKVYDCGKMMFQVADRLRIDITKDNTLNMDKNLLKALMGNVYEQIAEDISNREKPNQHEIISTHATFLWKHILQDSSNALFLDKVNPDMYITIIDTPGTIETNLKRNKKWQNKRPSLENVLHWQDQEMLITSQYWTVIGGGNSLKKKPKPYLALPKNQPPESLLKLMVNPDIKPVYCAFPMTNLEEKDSNQKINEFIQAGGGPLLETDMGLRDYFVVIDPRTYELKMGATEAENAHTVHRDLEYFVGHTKATICYFPEIVYSSGATNEMREAHNLSKYVYLVMDKEERSPFVDFNLSELFKEPKEFFEFLKEREKPTELKRPKEYRLDL